VPISSMALTTSPYPHLRHILTNPDRRQTPPCVRDLINSAIEKWIVHDLSMPKTKKIDAQRIAGLTPGSDHDAHRQSHYLRKGRRPSHLSRENELPREEHQRHHVYSPHMPPQIGPTYKGDSQDCDPLSHCHLPECYPSEDPRRGCEVGTQLAQYPHMSHAGDQRDIKNRSPSTYAADHHGHRASPYAAEHRLGQPYHGLRHAAHPSRGALEKPPPLINMFNIKSPWSVVKSEKSSSGEMCWAAGSGYIIQGTPGHHPLQARPHDESISMGTPQCESLRQPSNTAQRGPIIHGAPYEGIHTRTEYPSPKVHPRFRTGFNGVIGNLITAELAYENMSCLQKAAMGHYDTHTLEQLYLQQHWQQFPTATSAT